MKNVEGRRGRHTWFPEKNILNILEKRTIILGPQDFGLRSLKYLLTRAAVLERLSADPKGYILLQKSGVKLKKITTKKNVSIRFHFETNLKRIHVQIGEIFYKHLQKN